MGLLVQVLSLPAVGADSFAPISSLSFVSSWQSPSAFAFLDPYEDEI